MKRFSVSKFAAVLVALWVPLASPTADALGASGLTIRFYDYAGIDRGTTQTLVATAAHIFETAGLRMQWLNCRISWGGATSQPGCEGALIETVFIVRLLPRAAGPSRLRGQIRLGAATMAPEGGHYVDLYLDGIDKAARLHYILNPGQLMAHALAHEMGHLILRRHVHSATGIMRGRWSRDDYESMWRGRFVYTTWEQASLRQELAAHTAADRETPRRVRR